MINYVGCHFCHQTYQASLRVFRALFTASSLLRLPCEVQCCLVVHVLGIVIDARLGEQQSLQPSAYGLQLYQSSSQQQKSLQF